MNVYVCPCQCPWPVPMHVPIINACQSYLLIKFSLHRAQNVKGIEIFKKYNNVVFAQI